MIPAQSSGAACSSSKPLGQRVRVALVDNGPFGVAAVVVPSREPGRDAQVLVAAHAEATHAAGVTQPGDPDAVAHREPRRARAARVDSTDDLVAGHDTEPPGLQVALGEVEIGPADAAHADRDADLSGRRRRLRAFHGLERMRGDRPGVAHSPCPHALNLPRPEEARSPPGKAPNGKAPTPSARPGTGRRCATTGTASTTSPRRPGSSLHPTRPRGRRRGAGLRRRTRTHRARSTRR